MCRVQQYTILAVLAAQSAKTWFMVFHVNDVLRGIRQPLKYNIFVEKHCVFAVYPSHSDWLHRISCYLSLSFARVLSLLFIFIFLLILRFACIVIAFYLCSLSHPSSPTSLFSFPLALFISMACCIYILLVNVKA